MKGHFSGNSQFIKNLNQALVLNLVKDFEPIPRSEIAKLIKLSPTAVSNLTENLIKEGYLREKGPGSSAAGRKPILLELNSKARFVIGIDLERINVIKAVITDLRANIISRVERTLESTDFSMVVDLIIKTIRELINTSGIEIEKIAGIGIGSPGLIEYRTGKVIYSTHLGWKNMPLGASIQQEFDIPVVVYSEANTPALAEQRYGAGKKAQDLIYITLGPGLGAGIIVNGKIYRGISGTAGEFGHIIIDPDGPLCECGNRGCLETLAAESSIIKRANEGVKQGKKTLIARLIQDSKQGITPEIVYEAALKEDKFAIEVIQKTAHYLGMGLINLVNLLNPEMIIIGGNISQVGDIFIEPLRKMIDSHALPTPAKIVKVVSSYFGKDAGVIGAATLILDHIFKVPEIKFDLERLETILSRK